MISTSPASVAYFAGYWPSPFLFNSQNAQQALLLGRDGSALLVIDNVQEQFARDALAVEVAAPVWYRCVESAGDRSELVLRTALDELRQREPRCVGVETLHCPGLLLLDMPCDRTEDVSAEILRLRRAKDPDEVAQIRKCLEVAEAGLASARALLVPGMTEHQLRELVQVECCSVVGHPVLLYGDFVSGPRCEQGGGLPSSRSIAPGDLILTDFSVVLRGYRGDFASTFVCGGAPSADHTHREQACLAALDAGAARLRPGVACRDVFATVREVFVERKLERDFTHHAGHGIGLGHPEAPFLVPASDEVLTVGDVVTLEPGVYAPGRGGMRFEHDFLITADGCEQLSHHPLGLSFV